MFRVKNTPSITSNPNSHNSAMSQPNFKPKIQPIVDRRNKPKAATEQTKGLQMFMQQPKRVLHSKNPFKMKQKKINWDRNVKDEPLDGVTILRICKCEVPDEVLKLDISGKK